MRKRNNWSEEEIELLKSGLPITQLTSQLTHRTEKSIRDKMRDLQIYSYNIPKDGIERWKRWSEADNQYLLDNLNVKTTVEMANELNRTHAAVHKQLLNLCKKLQVDLDSFSNSWQEKEDQFLRENYGNLRAVEIAKKLGRTENSVRSRASFLGLKSRLRRAPWSEQELEILKQEFVGEKTSVLALAKKLMRSPASVRQKANQVGLCRTIRSENTRYRDWLDEEIKILQEFAGEVPLVVLAKKINQLCKKLGVSQRSYNSVRLQCIKLKIPYFCDGNGEYFSIKNIADALNAHDRVVLRWVDKYDKILNPIRSSESKGAVIYIPRANFKKFALQYPGEIARTRPDILWLISLFDKY